VPSDPVSMLPKAFLVRAKDPSRVAAGSSGGVFGLLAEAMVERGGSVAGAAFDEGMVLRHVVVRSAAGIRPLLKSKYLRSDTSTVRKAVADELSAGRDVLFCGTPCQVAAMRKAFPGATGLVTVDLLCHGTPSQDCFRAWLRELEEKHGSRVVAYDWRCKDHGWSPLETRVDFADGKTVYDRMDPYFYAFMNNLSVPEGCLRCPFANPRRQGDITLGDAWGLASRWKGPPAGGDNTGISLVLVNSRAGMLLFESAAGLVDAEDVPVSHAVGKQSVISGKGARFDLANRELFASVLKDAGRVSSAVQAVVDRERAHADDRIAALRRRLRVLRFASALPVVSKRARIEKKSVKAEIDRLEGIMRWSWNPCATESEGDSE